MFLNLSLQLRYFCFEPLQCLHKYPLTLRSRVNCPILGKPEGLKTSVLSTINDLKYYLHLKEESHKQKPRGLLLRIVDDVMQMWETYTFKTTSNETNEENTRRIL